MSSKPIKLTYFDIPGRGEPLRLAMWIGDMKFEDERIEFKDWPALKPKTCWGSLPMLTLPSGEEFAQTRTLGRFVGKKTGLYPEDPVAAMRVDEILDTVEDLQSATNSAGQGLEKKEKEKKRKEAMESGKPAKILKKLDCYSKKHGKPGYMVGDKITLADLFVFSYTGFVISSGFFDGVPTDALNDYPSLLAVRKTVASHPAVIKRYAAEKSSNPLFKIFAAFK